MTTASTRAIVFHAVRNGEAEEIAPADALQVTLPSGVSFLIESKARPDGAAMLCIPMDPESAFYCAFSVDPGATNLLFLRAETRERGMWTEGRA
jgi:hypothetical protein